MTLDELGINELKTKEIADSLWDAIDEVEGATNGDIVAAIAMVLASEVADSPDPMVCVEVAARLAKGTIIAAQMAMFGLNMPSTTRPITPRA